MQFMGATLRKITLKDGLTALLFSLALTGGLALAFKSSGRDMWEATDALVPVFIGGLAGRGHQPGAQPAASRARRHRRGRGDVPEQAAARHAVSRARAA